MAEDIPHEFECKAFVRRLEQSKRSGRRGSLLGERKLQIKADAERCSGPAPGFTNATGLQGRRRSLVAPQLEMEGKFARRLRATVAGQRRESRLIRRRSGVFEPTVRFLQRREAVSGEPGVLAHLRSLAREISAAKIVQTMLDPENEGDHGIVAAQYLAALESKKQSEELVERKQRGSLPVDWEQMRRNILCMPAADIHGEQEESCPKPRAPTRSLARRHRRRLSLVERLQAIDLKLPNEESDLGHSVNSSFGSSAQKSSIEAPLKHWR